jgi:hypothetical protein
MILLSKLFLAHLLGDFILQPDSWVKEKELTKHRSGKLYLHVLIHGLATMLLVWNIKFWLPALIIILSHYFIDLAKVFFQKPQTRFFWFVADQVLHLIVIGAVWYGWENPSFTLGTVNPRNALILITAIVFLTNPASVIIKALISQWTPDTMYTLTASLPDAGKFIGILERLFVLTFVIHHHWEAVGFLLAAKSVFRFGNLKESHDRKLTEYVLIGTFLSFGIALAVALLVSALTNGEPVNNI